ncbi:DNA gyrase inhibitor [Piscirickettsia salmonis]|uniref:DNA gyrase inhibitor YacG n=1 Tax=Piscirickettsia salmonis TaxID=1238 RepID=A0A9Q5VF66_PISSA|nr:DNA gyrase inhibitor YacG [Piscirickettsia salmonis]RNC78188.1 DNA gyrase inhibitor YacG [Piscirickettsiaceae bacterium NZ-RLO2]ALA23773.1 DNA gyrase inhibitor YacG [Piscirickettsia salmonis]APS44202.1 DNA gyrase inhibitor [Piscirickettsia salmonis]APS47562.1 DNA gyrase inhibitor [Piscirickettsia salmonis]APS51004.1 DNA gyrase inhibitor [Piscirickettsia salmonis]
MTLIRPCPTCQKDVDIKNATARPFCSERCRLIDLGAWAEESYKIPTQASNNEPFNPHD